tara:strand:- start:49 stop:1233 length:1185 start_codon:yes stop_codon:yes gene_type:complete
MATFTKRPGFEREVNSSGNYISEENSSTTLLVNAGVFTGGWVDVSDSSDVIVSLSTDQNGTYTVQFSPDGVNQDSTLTRYYRTDQINVPHRFTITRKFMRVVFTNNSGADQTYFRLQTLLGSYTNLNAPTDSTLAQDFDSIVVRPTDPNSEIVLGVRQGQAAFLKFGFNNDVGSAAEEVIASFGGTFTPLTAASTLIIVSSSTNDAAAGTGARTVFLEGLNAARKYQFEFITMNGTANVTSANSYLGVNRVVVFSSGSTNNNVGNISVTATTGGSNQAYIPATFGVTQQLIYFNPDGVQGQIRGLSFTCLKIAGGSSPRISIKLRVWNPKITDSNYVIRTFNLDTSVSNEIQRRYDVPIKLDPTDVLWVTVTTDQNSTVIEGSVDIIQYRLAAT